MALYRVFVDGGKVEQVLETGAITSFIVSLNGEASLHALFGGRTRRALELPAREQG